MSDWAQAISINKAEEQVQIDFGIYCTTPPPDTLSPIDAFYKEAEEIFLRAIDERAKPTEIFINRLLLLGLVSATELYFRRIIAGCVGRCPVTRVLAGAQQLSYGSLDYYATELRENGLLEIKMFSDFANIRNATKSLLSIDIQQASSVEVALKRFDSICEMRHAAVHSLGRLSAQNLMKLNMLSAGEQELKVTLDGLERARAICYSAVRAYNKHIFFNVIQRLLNKNIFNGNWADDKDRFTKLFLLFNSRTDNSGRGATAYAAYRKLRPALSSRMKSGSASTP